MNWAYENALKQIEEAYTTGATYLYLSSNQLSSLPPEIGKLQNLTRLYLSSNQLSSLPPEIGKLQNLTRLDLSYNQLSSLPPEIGKLQNLTKLDLMSNQLSSLPPEIGKLQNLTKLDLWSNQLSSLPPEIGKLQNLTKLSLSENQLSSLPPEIGNLQKLTELYLEKNQLSSLPKEIGLLRELERLVLYSNQLSNIPNSLKNLKKLTPNTENTEWERGLPLHKNQFGFPEEVYQKPPQELIQYILDWQKAKEQKPLHEAKVIIIGTGGAGKTSLVNMITKGCYNKDELKTEGIEITDWEVRRGEDTIDLHIWDFGGQEIMHATHKFFMTKRSIYVLVTNPRTEDQYGETNIDYWMKLIQSYAGKKVPVIIAINKCDIHKHDIGKGALQDRYPQIKAFIETSCAEDIGIDALKDAIQNSISALPHIDDTIPLTYFDIKNRLVKENREYISYSLYRDVCRKVDGEFEELSMKVLMGLLHDLGIMLNFQDEEEGEEIAQTQVLNPEWVTKGVYALINSPRLRVQKGLLSKTDIQEILEEKHYPSHKERRLIQNMMQRFELAYPTLQPGQFLVPGSLSKEKPPLSLLEGEAIRFRYLYETIVGSIMSRFIVRIHNLIEGKQLWRDGVVLKRQNCQAHIYAFPSDKVIHIDIRGRGNRRGMLSLIEAHFDDIHENLAAIGVSKEMFIQQERSGKLYATWYPYSHLLIAEEEGEKELFIPMLRSRIQVKQVLEGVRFARINLDRLKETEKIQVLFLSSTPEDASRLRVDEEYGEIRYTVRLSKYRDRFYWENRGAVRTKTFRQQLLWSHPQIVHFAGHGKLGRIRPHKYSTSIKEVGIILESENRRGHFVSGKRLRNLFREFKGIVECVILNACYSVEVADLLKGYVPYVIGVSGKVEDKTAIAFAVAFYEALGEGKGVKGAYSYALAALPLEGYDSDSFHLLAEGYRYRGE